MRYRVVAVGRVRDAALRAACDGYLERLRHYTRVEEREVKDEARILEGVPEGSRLVALSEAESSGRPSSSPIGRRAGSWTAGTWPSRSAGRRRSPPPCCRPPTAPGASPG